MQALINEAIASPLNDLMSAQAVFNNACSADGAVIRGVIYNSTSSEAIDPPDTGLSEALKNALNDWEMAAESENGSVIRYPGVIEVSASLIEATLGLNKAKSAFSEQIAICKKNGVTAQQLRTAYRDFGLARIHPLQVWRQIIVLAGENLSSVGFTVSKQSNSIVVMSKAQAVQRLAKSNADDIIGMIESLPSDCQIHWHTPIAEHVRANVVWEKEGTRQSKMYHAALPFLVPKGSWPAKRVRFSPPRIHATRSDKVGTICAPIPIRKGAFLVATKKTG